MTPFPLYRRIAGALAGSLLLAIFSTPSQAQNFPDKPVYVKVAFPAGGPADAAIRSSFPVLQRGLGQTVIADNLPGASGTIAAMSVWKASPDGYTLLGTTGADFLLAPLNIPAAKYQPDSFRALGIVSITDLVLVSSPAHAFKNVDELIDYAKRPGSKELSIAHWGIGSTPHIAAADLQARTGVKFLEVPYKGAAPVATDVAGGQVDLAFAPLGGPTLGLIQTGKLKVIGLAGQKRNAALPQAPLLSEGQGLKNFEYSIWVALFAPPKTSDNVALKLNKSISEWATSSENQVRVASGASRAVEPMNLPQTAAFLKKEQEKYTSVAKMLDLRP